MNIKPIDITEIPSDLRDVCLTAIPTSYRFVFTHHPDPKVETIITLGIFDQNHLLGLVIASLMTKALSAEILYLSNDYAQELLTALEALLREKKCFLVCMNYPAENADSLEKTLSDLQWGKPYQILERYFFDTTLFPKNWFKHKLQWPNDFKEFSWNALTEQERQDLQNQERAGSFPLSVSPFGEEEIIEPINSLGLRHTNEVIGWMITHRIAPDTIRYTSLYIHPQYRQSGYPIQLLSHSINLHLKHPIKWGIFDLNAEQTGSNWVKFIKKRLAPLAQRRIIVKRTWKALNT